MITLRSRIFIFISIIVLLVLGVSLLIIAMTRTKTPGSSGTATGTNVNGNTVNGGAALLPNQGPVATPVAGLKVRPQPTVEMQKNAVKQLARLFIERYNSFSTGNNWTNITEVKDLVTDDLWKTISAYIGRPNTNSIIVVTQAASVGLDDWQDDSAAVSVSALRSETANGTTKQLQKNYQVEIIKTGENWLVNKFTVVK